MGLAEEATGSAIMSKFWRLLIHCCWVNWVSLIEVAAKFKILRFHSQV